MVDRVENESDDELPSPPVVFDSAAATDLVEALAGGRSRKYVRFVMAALGSVPWIAALASLSAERDQDRLNDLLKLWVQEQQPKADELQATLAEIVDRLEGLGYEVEDRLQSPHYLALVRRAFRSWDDADTAEKREYVKRLITNAAAFSLTSDDLVRLFLSWIDLYHESHFAVIRSIYAAPGCTRARIWEALHPEDLLKPREDSADADLFKYLIGDLSIGRVIRQARDVTSDGEFMRKKKSRTGSGSSATMESAFEETKPYVLTELGKTFVHYVLTDVVRPLNEPAESTGDRFVPSDDN